MVGFQRFRMDPNDEFWTFNANVEHVLRELSTLERLDLHCFTPVDSDTAQWQAANLKELILKQYSVGPLPAVQPVHAVDLPKLWHLRLVGVSVLPVGMPMAALRRLELNRHPISEEQFADLLGNVPALDILLIEVHYFLVYFQQYNAMDT